MPDVRRIRPGERAAALATVVAAFRHDPQVRWWFTDETSYERDARAFFGVLLDTRTEGGEVWVEDGCRAVAMWIPPGGNLIGPEAVSARYAQVLADLPEAGARRIRATDEAVDSLLPRTAHWYLGVLACHPDHRGLGLGAAVAAPVLAAADRAGLPVALETSLPANVGYYTRRGFAVMGSVVLDDQPARLGARRLRAAGDDQGAGGDGAGCVTVWVMQRQPR